MDVQREVWIATEVTGCADKPGISMKNSQFGFFVSLFLHVQRQKYMGPHLSINKYKCLPKIKCNFKKKRH